MAPNLWMIDARALTRSFDERVAVDGLNLQIPAGQLFGLVGPDGAGKTTTLRMFAGLLKVSGGEATVAGYSLVDDPEAVKAEIGYMAQEFSLYGELTVTENLQFFASLYDLESDTRRERSERLLEFAGLTEFQQRRAANLSGGMKKKLALACTLIHQPPLLLLDEPTTGVDPVSRRQFWTILSDLNLSGTTIVVSTPYMDEADRCQRVGLIYGGKLVVCDTPRVIRESLPGDVIQLRPLQWQRARSLVPSLEGVREVQTYGESLHLIVDDASSRLPELKRALDSHGLGYHELSIRPPRMEEAFISLIRRMDTGKGLRT